MSKDVSAAFVMVVWVISVAGAFMLGVYLTYKNDRALTTYQEKQLQYLEDIRNSNDDIFSVLVQ